MTARELHTQAVINRALKQENKERYGVISLAQWEAWTPRQKSKVIDLQWQIPHAAETLGQAMKVVRLLLNWGCTVDWIPNKAQNGIYCIIDVSRSKIFLKGGVGFAPTLSESLCCAALRCVELLARN